MIVCGSIRYTVRVLVALAFVFLIACATAPAPDLPKPDPTKAAGYADAIQQLSALNREAEILFRKGAADPAADLIKKAQPLAQRVLSVPSPTFSAMEAASDLDLLYARMLLSNRHYGPARMIFQKDAARWRNWQPQSDVVVNRRKLAEKGLAECDRNILR